MPLSTITRGITSDSRIHHGRWIGPVSYATGGESSIKAAVDLPNRIESFLGLVARNAAGLIYLVVYDAVNDKLVWYVPTTGAEVGALTDLSGYTADFVAFGI